METKDGREREPALNDEADKDRTKVPLNKGRWGGWDNFCRDI